MSRLLEAADRYYRLQVCVLVVLATTAVAALQAGL
jgi:hypothetical protein